MPSLSDSKCVACRRGEPAATHAKITELSTQIPAWEIIEVDGIQRLQRIFKLKNFVDALAFTNKVGVIAEEEDHHPLIVTEWGRVTVQWWTHVVRGLHKNDFVMAAKTDGIV